MSTVLSRADQHGVQHRRTAVTRASVAALGLVLVAGALSACSSGTSTGTPTGTALTTAIGLQLEEARLGGAGDRQLEVLEAAARTGSLAYEDVIDLIHDTFACFEESGLGYTEHAPTEWVPGWVVPAYSFDAEVEGLTETQVLGLADACMAKHSMFAEFVLQDPTANQEIRDDYMRTQLPSITSCLSDNGVEIDDEATLDEIRLASLELLNATTDAGETVSCYDDVSTS